MNALEAANEKYEILSLPESDKALAWVSEHFPIASWGRILWSEVADNECVEWFYENLPVSFKALCEKQELESLQVVVVWNNASKPAFRLSLEAVQQHIIPIVDTDADTWVVCQAEGWCIEISHEGDLCFGRVLVSDKEQ